MASPAVLVESSLQSKKTYGFNRGLFKRAKKRKSPENANSNKAQQPAAVAWDYIKCRPIYSSVEKVTADVGETDNDQDEDTDESFDDPEQATPIVRVIDWDQETKSLRRKEKPLKKLKAYGGSSKRQFGVARTNLSNFVASKKTAVVRPTPQAPRYHNQNKTIVPYKSPLTPLDGSICDTLQNSVTKLSMTVTTTRADGMVLKRRSTANRGANTTAAAAAQTTSSSSVFDFCETDTVSANTNVSAARAYFDRLDARHLVLENSNSVSKTTTTTACTRTRRRVVMEGNDELREEYNAYSRSIMTVSAPVSFQEYANNRSVFFRPNQMYDGFLDG